MYVCIYAMEFYLILPSNASPVEHSENTPSQFKVTLQDPIQLDGDWEVGVEEVTYVQTFYTIVDACLELTPRTVARPDIHVKMAPAPTAQALTHEENKYFKLTHQESVTDKPNRMKFVAKKQSKRLHFYMSNPHAVALGFKRPPAVLNPAMPVDENEDHYLTRNATDKDMIVHSTSHVAKQLPPKAGCTIAGLSPLNHRRKKRNSQHRFRISPGYYPTPESIVEYLNVTSNIVTFVYKKVTNRFSMHVKKAGYTLIFDGKSGLNDVLGFKQKTYSFKRKDEVIEAEYAPSMFAGSHSLFIYCSICADMDVANVKVPLLRTVAIDTKANFGDVVNVEYKTPMYVPLRTNYLSLIEVDIRNDMGDRIHFVEGKTQLVLHFRQKRGSDMLS